MSYYAVQTSENKEFQVKERILALVNGAQAFVPTKLSKVAIGKNTFVYYEKLLPEYVILKHDNITKSMIGIISEIRNVELFVQDKMDTSEAELFVSGIEGNQFNVFNGKASVILGEYAGTTCDIVSVKGDEAHIVLDNSARTKLRLPVWNLGKKTKIGQE